MNYKTPGAYVEEISKFPPSVAQVETAIPAFVGYTQTGPKNEPTRLTSMLEYEAIFGGAKPEKAFSVVVTPETATQPASAAVTVGTVSGFKMYYAMQMYFANGGGPCYVVSVGNYGTQASPTTIVLGSTTVDGLRRGLETLVKEDEPTLIVFPDAEALTTTAYSLYNDALEQAEKLGDRFVIMDTIGGVTAFRAGVTKALKYGAAYHPKLETVLSYKFNNEDVTVTGAGTGITDLASLKASTTLAAASSLYNQAKNAIEANRVILTPSSTIAGIYAKTDSTAGVWKAPANTGLSYVVAPTEKISSQDQESLNVDPTSGKSINAIRTFTGKGTLVWGARTLDGNSNEWRYVSVRRFFNMVEESVVKATQGFVFEANNAQTWVRMEAMIGNFLNQQWMNGALAGSKPEDAYYVSVGLNKTMSAQDILEGRMNVEIGMAAVRPAEFIVLRFSHKLQES
ncbi:MAG: phage tail sheath C-terminal domain-containing protein [Flavobacterium sp.]|nr:phage tail sheath C-terminal domain-containing protein [Flavobacterium sp.]